jgi:hypothetical protein
MLVWHPQFDLGETIIGGLHDHYRRNLFINVTTLMGWRR